MRDGEAAAELAVVFDVVDEEGGRVQHADGARDDLEAVGGHLEPGVEGLDERRAEVLARVPVEVVEGPGQDAVFLLGPGAPRVEEEVLGREPVRVRRGLGRDGHGGGGEAGRAEGGLAAALAFVACVTVVGGGAVAGAGGGTRG